MYMPGRLRTGSNPSSTVMSLAVYAPDAMYIICVLKRLGRLSLATMIVAAIQAHLVSAATVSEDAPVAGGRAAIAAAFDVQPIPDRARFVGEMARLIYG